MRLGILSGHDEDQIGTLDGIAAHGGRLHAVGDHDRIRARHLDRRAAELMCEKGQEGLGSMATRPTAGDLAQTGIEALAVERLRMGPEGRYVDHTSELQAIMRTSAAVYSLTK